MKVTNDVIGVLSECRTEGNALFLPPTQLERSLYTSVNKVLEAMGGKWDRKFKAHLFTAADPADRLDDVILTGEIVSEKQQFQYFPTPLAVAERLVELADIPELCSVLEPSAGEGAIADVIRTRRPNAQLTCVELNERFAETLIAKGHTTVACQDFLSFRYSDDGPGCERVVANPPFTRQQDVDHVWHMLSVVKPGGRVVSVMSAGVLYRSNKKTLEFREHVEANGGSFIELPTNSFAESGTAVNACIVVVNKPSN